MIFTTIRLGLVDTTPNERHATYDKAPSPETALAICQAAGGDLVDLFDILFTGWERTGNMANQLGMLLNVIDPVALAQARPDDLLAAADRIDAAGRVAILDRLRRWELFGHAGLRDMGFRIWADIHPSDQRAVELMLARMPVEAALAEAPARLAARNAADRGLMIRLLVAHVQNKDVQDVLRAHRDTEKAKTNIAAIDTALRSFERKARDAVSTDKQGHGYRAIDGSWVEAPEIPLKVTSFMQRLEDTIYLGGGHHRWGKLDPEELWPRALRNLERLHRWFAEGPLQARAAIKVVEAFPKTPESLLTPLEARARRITPRDLSKGARAALQDLPGLSDRLLGELTDNSAATARWRQAGWAIWGTLRPSSRSRRDWQRKRMPQHKRPC
ncbi:MAG: hypothetical protein JKP98_19215 [Rhodobacteraceae bacterium]|nr:hypothetical protein [Paracoccaceae bacterium]